MQRIALAAIVVLAACNGAQAPGQVDAGSPGPATPPATVARPSEGTLPVPRAPRPEVDERRFYGPGLDVEITISRYGSIDALASTGSSCTASSTLPSGQPDTSEGLRAVRLAGRDRRVGWSYQTDSGARAGTGLHSVQCARDGHTVSATAVFSIP